MPRPTDTFSAAEFGQLRAFLAKPQGKPPNQTPGFTQAWINSVIGTAPAGRTRAQITDLLRAALRILPKA